MDSWMAEQILGLIQHIISKSQRGMWSTGGLFMVLCCLHKRCGHKRTIYPCLLPLRHVCVMGTPGHHSICNSPSSSRWNLSKRRTDFGEPSLLSMIPNKVTKTRRHNSEWLMRSWSILWYFWREEHQSTYCILIYSQLCRGTPQQENWPRYPYLFTTILKPGSLLGGGKTPTNEKSC